MFAGRPIKEYIKPNANGARQRNGIVNDAPPPPINSWRVLDRKPIERKENSFVVKEVKEVSANEEPRELVNLASMLNKAKIDKKPKVDSKNIVSEVDVLKKMLGLGQPMFMANKSSQDIKNDLQKIDLNSLFNKQTSIVNDVEKNLPDLSSLPKPPAAWHQKPPKNVQPTAIPAPPSQHRQSQPQFPNNMAMNIGAPPMYQPQFFPPPPPQHANMAPSMNQSMNLPFIPPMHAAPHLYRQPTFVPGTNFPLQMMGPGPIIPGPQPFIQVPHQMPHHMQMAGPRPGTYVDWMSGKVMGIPHHSPEGPQKLKPKNGTSSAFIPLQAARKNVKSKSNANIPPNDDDTTKNADQQPADEAPEVFQQ